MSWISQATVVGSLLLALPGWTLAQSSSSSTTSTITTTAPDTQITPAPSESVASGNGATMLRPSSGEIVTAGQMYTVRWTPPPPGPLAIEVYTSEVAVSDLIPSREGCDGWLVNTDCDKFNMTLASGSTSYVWNLTSPFGYYLFDYTGEAQVRLGVYVDNLSYGDMPSEDAPWYAESEFTIREPESSDYWTVSYGTATSLPTTTTTATTTPTGTGTDAVTDAAVALGMRGRWTVTVGVWAMLVLCIQQQPFF